eukprot:scaffold393_cov554-Prasinococcus_capsulatus_cf.AAC.3
MGRDRLPRRGRRGDFVARNVVLRSLTSPAGGGGGACRHPPTSRGMDAKSSPTSRPPRSAARPAQRPIDDPTACPPDVAGRVTSWQRPMV